MIYYEGWQEEYTALAKRVLSQFSSEEVLFISMGSVTFIKPVMKAIRKRDRVTKMLQMEMVRDPNGKWTYPDDLKVEMFRAMFKVLQSWREKVFFYLCMEKRDIWLKTFGFVYPDNVSFENDFQKHLIDKQQGFGHR